jgi:putative molybdopterin biosynthesis protein
MDSDRNVYLQMKTLEEAREILFQAFSGLPRLSSENLPVPDAVGRVLSHAVSAILSSPAFHAAAMDGIAVRAENTFGASESNPMTLQIGSDAFFVNTGHVLPEGTNAVIMIEHVQSTEDNRVIIEAPAFPWQNIRRMGEDIVATQLLFPQNHVITPYSVGALLSGGIFQVAVRKKPRVLILPTGSELLDWQNQDIRELSPGQVVESNSHVLGSLVKAWGGEFVRHGIIRDNFEEIRDIVRQGELDGYDIILTVGGSSAGSEDFSRRVIQELGTVLVHGVTMMPGKPVIIGKIRGKPVFGVPGYPVSAIVAFEQFIGPLICRMLEQPEIVRPKIDVTPVRKIPSKLGLEEFLRVKLGMIGDRTVAIPLPRGAGSITTLTQADGIIRIPHPVEGLPEDKMVQAELLRPLDSLRRTIVIVGSHDNTLDVLADMLNAGTEGFSLSSSHVGSMGGLTAIRKGVCHAAGSHLLDTTDGTYNTSYIRKHLAGIPVRRVQLVFRDQGLIVPRGNPKGIRGIEDLVREDIRFINRQSGSGTRILLDFRLSQLGIDPAGIAGYDQDEFTHMAVAVAVLGGSADVGLGIFAAAKALGLDFIPVVTEQYDLIIPEAHFPSDGIQAMLSVIRSPEFRSRVEELGGYHTERTGTILE